MSMFNINRPIKAGVTTEQAQAEQARLDAEKERQQRTTPAAIAERAAKLPKSDPVRQWRSLNWHG